jgi:segregation and condensation protein B
VNSLFFLGDRQQAGSALGTQDGDPSGRFARGPGATNSEFHRQFLLRRGSGVSSANRTDVELGPDGRRTRKAARVEAVLFVSDSAVSARRLAQLVTLADSAEAAQIVDQLNASYDRDGSAFRIERAANGYRLLTRPAYARWLDRLHLRQSETKLSPSALETLTVIAYRQPITRADIEAIRGVQCSEIIRQLMERGLVRIAGEDNSLGRPYLYETTRTFLELFGLRSLEELPLADRFRATDAGQSAARSGDARKSA